MAVRETIAAALATQLATITTANGYHTNVHVVVRDVRAPAEDITPNLKAEVNIIDEGEPEPITYFDSGIALLQWNVTVRCEIKGASYGDVTDTLAQNWISDIHELLDKPISLGANVRFVVFNGTTGAAPSKSKVIVDVQLAIVYFIDRTSP